MRILLIKPLTVPPILKDLVEGMPICLVFLIVATTIPSAYRNTSPSASLVTAI